ncbi:E3 ubiquitin-protein ligase [Rhynchospora pubera]|uniref:E3 ubiquitin-protein ligase n=1 Tax=Rhynchospora pubera TaxID=906938 RepID=A0AAV8CAH5_9POAL|nr:E3 ubiquitin-protein ligase [Rhynchospora pubera]
MSRRSGKASSPRLDLQLNLSPPNREEYYTSRRSPTGSSFSSSPSSCLPSENEHEATSMVLAGCPRCFMYVLLSEEDPTCPKCKSPVLIDLLSGGNSCLNMNKKKNRRT